MDESRLPVLVGCGQITQRQADPLLALNPMDLTAAAAVEAAQDSGAGQALIDALDTIVVLRSFSDTSWRFKSPFSGPENPPVAIAKRLGSANVQRNVYTWPGGNMPQWSINRLFEMVTRGEVQAALLCGGEALATQKSAIRAGIELNWSEPADSKPLMWGVSDRGWSDCEERHGMAGAIFAYPLFENAIRAHRGHSIEQHQLSMGRLFAGFADVAKGNPLADRRDGYTAAALGAVSGDNPYIGFPYTRLLNANAFIDQSAAVILTSVAQARSLGIARDRWVFLQGCADAHDHWFVSDRVNYHSSPAMGVVAEQALRMASLTIDAIDLMDIYSCFPSAVTVACQEMGIDDSRELTVTGGLPYFGGPGNNYVTHAIAQTIHELRGNPDAVAMVTANGNYLTKQSLGIYSTQQPADPFVPTPPPDYQNRIDAQKGPVFVESTSGSARVETYTVMHKRGEPERAILFLRMDDGRRCIANTENDTDLMRHMCENEMVGTGGVVRSAQDGRNLFLPR